jgi:hypothetical protein
MTPNQIEQRRDRIYRRSRSQRIRTMEQAAEFIDTVGFCLLFASTQGIELPSLFEAVKGRRDAHIEDWDADSDRVWVWKNELPADKRAYYGKALAGGKPVFISVKMLPYLYALNGLVDPHEEYTHGRLSLEAKRIYDTLRALGPTPTKALRVAAGFDRPDNSHRYHRALDELQRLLVILPVGATLETGAWTSQIFDLLERWFPRPVARAQRIDMDQARRVLVKRYVQTVVAAQPQMIARVFGWSRPEVNAVVDELVMRRVLSLQENWIVVE